MIHIIDDNRDVLSVMAELVETFGYKVKTFLSGRDYLDYASSDDYRPPLAVITDVIMPEIDGFFLMQRVRAMHPQVRFVVMSGEDYDDGRDKLGACFYLRKPIRFERLENAFRHLHLCIRGGVNRELAASLEDDRKQFGILVTGCPFTTKEN